MEGKSIKTDDRAEEDDEEDTDEGKVESQDDLLEKFLTGDPRKLVESATGPIPVAPDTGFVAVNIYSGYTFRRMIEMIAENVKEGTIRFSHNRIKITQKDRSGRLFINAKMYTYKLTDYIFRSSTPELHIGVNFEELKSYCSAAGRKQSVTFTCDNGRAKLVVFGKDEQYDYWPSIKPIEYIHYKLRELYPRGKEYPNVTCLGTQLSQALVHMNKIHGNVIVYCYQDGIEICPPDGRRAVAMIGKCLHPIILSGTMTPVPSGEEDKYRDALRTATRKLVITKDVVKTLGKIKHICGTGTVRIYIEGKSPLKISTELDRFGIIDVLVRDENSI